MEKFKWKRIECRLSVSAISVPLCSFQMRQCAFMYFKATYLLAALKPVYLFIQCQVQISMFLSGL